MSKYYVFVQGRGWPNVVHDDFGKAKQEAKRLARKERADTQILKIIKTYYVDIKVKERRPGGQQ